MKQCLLSVSFAIISFIYFSLLYRNSLICEIKLISIQQMVTVWIIELPVWLQGWNFKIEENEDKSNRRKYWHCCWPPKSFKHQINCQLSNALKRRQKKCFKRFQFAGKQNIKMSMNCWNSQNTYQILIAIS